jgi:hypothetical protein
MIHGTDPDDPRLDTRGATPPADPLDALLLAALARAQDASTRQWLGSLMQARQQRRPRKGRGRYPRSAAEGRDDP